MKAPVSESENVSSPARAHSHGTRLTPPPLQRKENKTGMSDQLKSGVENLSGIDMSDVKVHYNSSQPAQLNAHAYAQGNQMHIAPGQEKHLPHEAWHVVQQKQGRVRPTRQLKGKTSINDDESLEKEADRMGAIAQAHPYQRQRIEPLKLTPPVLNVQRVIQRKTVADLDAAATRIHALNGIPNNNPVFTIGATHTGDMYQVKAAQNIARVTHSNILLWGVTRVNNDPSLNSAESMAVYFGGIAANVFYKTGNPPHGQNLNNARKRAVADHTWANAVAHGLINEGGASSIIMYGFDQAREADEILGPDVAINHSQLRDQVADSVAPVAARGPQYLADLTNTGHFHVGTPYVLVNFRQSGHQGGAHPPLDTGERGFRQLLIAVRGKFPGATPVPVGEYDPQGAVAANKPNLINYWNTANWPSVAGGRGPQAGLIRYLKQNFNIRGAIGMRSGVMDLISLAGIPIISIDMDPFQRNAGNPTDTQDDGANAKARGWDRGMKLEKALGNEYGRVFLRDPRPNENAAAMANWPGEFSRDDDDRIRSSIDHYFNGINPATKHSSHPIDHAQVVATITHLEQQHLAAGALTAGEQRVANRLKGIMEQNADYTGLTHAQAVALIARINAL